MLPSIPQFVIFSKLSFHAPDHCIHYAETALSLKSICLPFSVSAPVNVNLRTRRVIRQPESNMARDYWRSMFCFFLVVLTAIQMDVPIVALTQSLWQFNLNSGKKLLTFLLHSCSNSFIWSPASTFHWNLRFYSSRTFLASWSIKWLNWHSDYCSSPGF